MANEFSKEELSKIKVKEDNNRANALKNSAKHDAEVIQGLKQRFGMGQPAAPAPMPPQAPAAPTAPQGMKKGGKAKAMCSGGKATKKMASGGKVKARGCGIAQKGLTKGKIC